MSYTVTLGLITEILGHTSDKGCPYAEILSTARTYVCLFTSTYNPALKHGAVTYLTEYFVSKTKAVTSRAIC